jgi:hypothetical protein
MEEMWALHGSVVYLGIPRFIYQLPAPADVGPVVDQSVARFLRGWRREAEVSLAQTTRPDGSG